MQINKTETIRNLKVLESEILDRMTALTEATDMLEVADLTIDAVASEVKMSEALMFIRVLIDDIDSGRITEFPMIERTNIMTGNTFLEDEDTPYHCSPSSEAYWSM